MKKTAPDGTALAGAKFELFKAVDMKEYLPAEEGGYKCKLATITPAEQLQELSVCKDGSCEKHKVEQIKVPGGNADGTFTTDNSGEFVPHNEHGEKLPEWLEAGTYCYREVTAPEGYSVDSAVHAFEVEEKAGTAHIAVVNKPETA